MEDKKSENEIWGNNEGTKKLASGVKRALQKNQRTKKRKMEDDKEPSVILLPEAGQNHLEKNGLNPKGKQPYKKENIIVLPEELGVPKAKHHHFHNEGGTFNPGRFFVGVVLIFLGTLFFGEEVGWFSVINAYIVSLWPLAFIIAGLLLLVGKKGWKFISAIIGILLVFLFGATYVVKDTYVIEKIMGISVSGDYIEERRGLSSSVHTVVQGGSGNVFVEQGKGPSLIVRGDRALLNAAHTGQDGDIILLTYRTPLVLQLLRDTIPPDFLVMLPNVQAISLLGSGNIKSSLIKGEKLEIFHSGSGNIEIEVAVETLVAYISGSGSISVKGTNDRSIVYMSGSGNYEALGLDSRETGIRLSGLGSAFISVSQELDVEIKGSGTIHYRGDPMISNSKISGSGEILKETFNE